MSAEGRSHWNDKSIGLPFGENYELQLQGRIGEGNRRSEGFRLFASHDGYMDGELWDLNRDLEVWKCSQL